MKFNQSRFSMFKFFHFFLISLVLYPILKMPLKYFLCFIILSLYLFITILDILISQPPTNDQRRRKSRVNRKLSSLPERASGTVLFLLNHSQYWICVWCTNAPFFCICQPEEKRLLSQRSEPTWNYELLAYCENH